MVTVSALPSNGYALSVILMVNQMITELPITKEERLNILQEMRREALKTCLELEMSLDVMHSESMIAKEPAYMHKLNEALARTKMQYDGQVKAVRMIDAKIESLKKALYNSDLKVEFTK